MLQDIIIHLHCHLVDPVVAVIVHNGISKHQHHVTLELRRRPDYPTLDVLLNLTQIHPPERRKKYGHYCKISYFRAGLIFVISKLQYRIYKHFSNTKSDSNKHGHFSIKYKNK